MMVFLKRNAARSGGAAPAFASEGGSVAWNEIRSARCEPARSGPQRRHRRRPCVQSSDARRFALGEVEPPRRSEGMNESPQSDLIQETRPPLRQAFDSTTPASSAHPADPR